MGKRQPRPEPFSIEELEEIARSPALQGFEKVLQYRPILVEPPQQTVEDRRSSTVVHGTSSTVELESPSTVVEEPPSTVEEAPASTVEGEVSPSPSPSQQCTPDPHPLWIAEGAAGVFTFSRVKRIVQAQDALTHVEEAVYDALWGTKKKDGEPYRLTQMGYTELASRSRVSKRSIQSVIDRLLEKEFIRIDTPPDITRRKSTVYRVLGYATVLKNMRDSGRHYVLRTGKGVFYASPLNVPASTVEAKIPSTVVDSSRSTVANGPPSTVDSASTVTVEPAFTSTVEATSTHNSLGNTAGKTSSSGNAVAARIVKLLPIDDDAVSRLVANCRRNDPEASEDEIGYCAELWIRENARNTSIRKPVAVMLTAVPKFFESPATEINRYRASKAREAEQSREAARSILADPDASESERGWARAMLGESAAAAN